MPEPTDTLNARERVIDRLRLERSAALRRAEAAEAEVARLREREAHLPRDLVSGHWKERAEAAEARVARLEEALREVLELQSTEGTYGVDWTERWGWQPKFKVIACRALAHEEEKA